MPAVSRGCHTERNADTPSPTCTQAGRSGWYHAQCLQGPDSLLLQTLVVLPQLVELGLGGLVSQHQVVDL